MNKRAYIFCLCIFFVAFIIAYLAGAGATYVKDEEVTTKEEAYVNGNTSTTASEESDNEIDGYWIKSVDGKIVVYRKDGKTVFAKTEIRVENLTEREISVLENGLYIETPDELFNYLESNTS